MTKHFQSIVRLGLSIVLAGLVFSSCGGPKFADSAQIKSFIFMESIDLDYKFKIANDFYGLLSNGKIKDIFIPDDKVYLEIGQDGYEANPWPEYFKYVFCRGKYWPIKWVLDEDAEWNYLCDEWREYINPKDIDKSLKYDEDKLSYYMEMEDEENIDWYIHDINKWNVAKAVMQNSTDFAATGMQITNAYIQYIKSIANKEVDIYDCQYSEAYSTKSVDAYYVIYTIGQDFYVLVRLSEEKKSQRFEVEQIMRGDQLIEIERKLKSLTGE